MDICITFSSAARNGAGAAVVSCDNGSRAGMGLLAGWRLTRSTFFQKFNSRFTQNFTLLTSHIDHRKMYNLTSHFSYHISRFTFQIPHLHTYLTFYSLYLVVWSVICEVGNVKWESQITIPRWQMWFVKQTWNVNSIFGKMRSCKWESRSHL